MAPNHVLDATLTQRFNTFLKAIRFDLQLQSKLRLSANRYWNDVYALLRSALSDSALSHVEQTHLTAALMNSYGNIVTELSVDLVERAEHWIRFLSMVETVTGGTSSSATAAADANSADPSDLAAAQLGLPADWLARCPDRYFKFLLLQGALCEQYAVKLSKLRAKGQSSGAHDDGPGPKLVMPTFDILIAYTTHVLTPNAYYTYSLAHFYRVINFHFYAEAAMVKAYTRTRKLWRKRYGEEYEEVPSGQSNLGSLLSKHRWRKLLKLGGKIVMLPLSLVVVSTVMLLGGGSSAASAATAVAPPSAGGAGGRRETEVTGEFGPMGVGVGAAAATASRRSVNAARGSADTPRPAPTPAASATAPEVASVEGQTDQDRERQQAREAERQRSAGVVAGAVALGI